MNDAAPRFDHALMALFTGLGLLLVLAGPLVFSHAVTDVFVLPKLLPVALGAALLWASGARSGVSLKAPLVALWIVLAICTVASSDLGLSLFGPRAQQFLSIMPLAVATLVYLGAAGRITPSAAGTGVLAVAVAAAIMAVASRFGFGAVAFPLQDGRACGPMGNPTFLGALLALALPLAFDEAVEGSRALGGAALLSLVAGLVAARCRGGLAAGGLGVGAYIVMADKQWRPVFIAIGSGTVAALLVALVVSRNTLHGSDIGRWESWKIAWTAWRARPLLGWGPDAFQIPFHRFETTAFVAAAGNDKTAMIEAHNDILQVLATMGLAGLAAYSGVLWGVVRSARRAMATPGAAGVAAALIALFLQAKVNEVPFAVLACAAILVASLEPAGDVLTPSWGRQAGVLASLALFCLAGRLVAADVYEKRGGMSHDPFVSTQAFNRAAELNPWDLVYEQMRVNTLLAVLSYYPAAQQQVVARVLVREGERAVAMHPNDPTAHEIMAIVLKLATPMLGVNFMARAQQEIKVAREQAPTYSGYRWQAEHLNEFLVKNDRATPGVDGRDKLPEAIR